MDYSTFLNGTLKEELDRLDWLAGDFRIQASKLVIEASFEGRKSSDDMQKMIRKFMPEGLIDIIDGMEKFKIVEKMKGGRRTWTYRDVNGGILVNMVMLQNW